MATVDRKQFLRLGALGAAGAALGSASPARAAFPTPTPVGDDVGFVQLGAVGERISLEYYRTARHATVLAGPERRRVALARDTKARQFAALNAALGEDALTEDDFAIAFPAKDLSTHKRLVTLGRDLEAVLVALYLNGVHNAQDRSTRLLLGRLLAYDVQQLAWLRGLHGQPDMTEVPAPLSVELAGAQLDRFLSTPAGPA
jgi:hypothetical protein